MEGRILNFLFKSHANHFMLKAEGGFKLKSQCWPLLQPCVSQSETSLPKISHALSYAKVEYFSEKFDVYLQLFERYKGCKYASVTEGEKINRIYF